MVCSPRSHAGVKVPFILSLYSHVDFLNSLHASTACREKVLELGMVGFCGPGPEMLLVTSTHTSRART